MSIEELKRQIEGLEKRFQSENLLWNEKLREKEKENFQLRQEHNQKKVELNNEIARLKHEISRVYQNKEAEIIHQSDVFNGRIKEKEKKIEELVYEKEQLIQKNSLKLSSEKAQYEQKINEFDSIKTKLTNQLKEYKKNFRDFEDKLHENKNLAEHEKKILAANFEKEKVVLTEKYTYKQHEFEEQINALNDKIASLDSELEDKEKSVKRAENIREAEISVIRQETLQKINQLSNVLEETTRQKDDYCQELQKIKKQLNKELELKLNENEFLHSKLILREEELIAEIQNKNTTIGNLAEETNRIQQISKTKIREINDNWAEEKNIYLKEIDSLRLEADKQKKETENLNELRDLENNIWRKKVEQLEKDYHLKITLRDVEEEEKEENYINKIDHLQLQLNKAERNLEDVKCEKQNLVEDFRKKLTGRRYEIDNLNRAIENLKAVKDDEISRKKAEFERIINNFEYQLKEVQIKLKRENQGLQEKLDNIQQEKHELELQKSRTVESLLQQVKAKREELDNLKRMTIEREAEWNKRLLESKQEKELSEEDKNRKEEELEKLKVRLQQETREMAEALEKKREHWEWLLAQKQAEINRVKRESQEEILHLKEEHRNTRVQLEDTRFGLEKAIRELSDKMEKERAEKYIELKEKDEKISELKTGFEKEHGKLRSSYEEKFKELDDRKISLQRNIRELESKLVSQKSVWEEKLIFKEKELESVRNSSRHREEELYNIWKEKKKVSEQKIIELNKQFEEIKAEQKFNTSNLERGLEAQKKFNWEIKLGNVRREKEVEAEYYGKLSELQKDKDQFENEVKTLRDELNIQRINAFRKLRETEDEIQKVKEDGGRENEGFYKKYQDKVREIEEIKLEVETLKIEKDIEVENIRKQLVTEKDEKRSLLHEIKLKEEYHQRIIQQKREDFDREKAALVSELKKLENKQEELIKIREIKEEENKREIKKLKEEIENKELRLIEEFKEKEKELIIKKAELEVELNKTTKELNHLKVDLDLKENEVRRQISGEYENKIYRLRLDGALAKSELDWVREKLNSERERFKSDLEDSLRENKKLKMEVSGRISELEDDYNEKSKKLYEHRMQLEYEKEEYQKRMDEVRISYQKKTDDLHNEIYRQRHIYEKNIEDIKQHYAEINRESANVRHSLELKIDELKSKLKDKDENNQNLSNQLSEYMEKYKELQNQMEERRIEYMQNIQLLNEEIKNSSGKAQDEVKFIQIKAEEEKGKLQARFIQIEKNLKLEIEDKRQKLIARENEIKNLKDEFNNIKERSAYELKVADEKLRNNEEREKELKENIAEMRRKVHEAESKTLESTLHADTINKNRQTEIEQFKSEIERIKQSHIMEKSILQGESDRLKHEIQEIKDERKVLLEMIKGKEEQMEKVNKNLYEVRNFSMQQIEEKKVEISYLKDQMKTEEYEWQKKIEEKERQLNLEYQRKLDERENHWQSREKELLAYRNSLQEEVEELKKEKLTGDRMWDVRLRDKEEELKNIQLEKAQNESKLTIQFTKTQESLNEFRSKYNNSEEMLREREEQNMELRAQMAQRDIQWKTAYRNKQVEVERLTFELHQSRRGLLTKFVQLLTGTEKREKQMLEERCKTMTFDK